MSWENSDSFSCLISYFQLVASQAYVLRKSKAKDFQHRSTILNSTPTLNFITNNYHNQVKLGENLHFIGKMYHRERLLYHQVGLQEYHLCIDVLRARIYLFYINLELEIQLLVIFAVVLVCDLLQLFLNLSPCGQNRHYCCN